MLLDELTKVLELSWNKNTCSPSLQDSWNENNKALGQCAITALINASTESADRMERAALGPTPDIPISSLKRLHSLSVKNPKSSWASSRT